MKLFSALKVPDFSGIFYTFEEFMRLNKSHADKIAFDDGFLAEAA